MEDVNEILAARQPLSNAAGKTALNCSSCSKSFLKRRDYNRHRKTHDRPYHCSLCLQKFALRTDLERHGAQHEHSSARFQCAWPGCRHGSVRKDNLLKHMNRAHLAQDELLASGKEQEMRKKKVLRLYKKATENEKLLVAERARKITLLEATTTGDESIVRDQLDNWISMRTSDALDAPSLSEAMHSAAESVNATAVLPLRAKGVSVDVLDSQGNTLLGRAANNGHDAIVKLLLEHGAVVDGSNSSYYTPLWQAARNGHDAIVKLLLEHGAVVDSSNSSYSTPLMQAANNGHDVVVKLLLEHGAVIDGRYSSYSTPLWQAANNGHGAVVKLLLEHGAAVDAADLEGNTALSLAAKNGHEAAVIDLIERGTEFHTKDWQYYKPVIWAAKNGHQAVVNILLEARAKGGDLESLVFGRTQTVPPFPLLDKLHEIVVKFWIEDGAANDSRDSNGDTMLLWAIKAGHEALVNCLIEHGAATESEGRLQMTPLCLASKRGSESIVRLLLERGADLEHRSRGGYTPLHIAVEWGRPEAIVRLLLDARPDITTKTDSGIDLLASCGRNEIKSLIKGYATRRGHRFHSEG